RARIPPDSNRDCAWRHRQDRQLPRSLGVVAFPPSPAQARVECRAKRLAVRLKAATSRHSPPILSALALLRFLPVRSSQMTSSSSGVALSAAPSFSLGALAPFPRVRPLPLFARPASASALPLALPVLFPSSSLPVRDASPTRAKAPVLRSNVSSGCRPQKLRNAFGSSR